MKDFLFLSSLLFVSIVTDAQVIEEEPAPEPVFELVEEAPEPPRYNQSFTSGIHLFKEGELRGLKDYGTGEVLLEAEYQYLKSDHPGLYTLSKNSKWGAYSLAERKLTIPIENAFVMPFNRQLPSGKKVVFFEVIKSYDYPSKGILDNNYNVLVPAEYDQVDYFQNFLRLRLGGNWGVYFYDRQKEDIPVVYDYVLISGEDNFSVRKDELFQLFDRNGKQLFGEQKLIVDFSGRWENKTKDHLLISNQDGKMGIFHLASSTMLLPQEYDVILDRFYNQYTVQKNGAWGIVDANNKKIVPFKYEAISFLKPKNTADTFGKRIAMQDKQTLISVRKNGKYGLINRQGELLTKMEFDQVEHLYGFYSVKKNGKYTVINSSGEPICKESFDFVGHFHKGKAAVFNEGKKFYLKTDGTLVAALSKNGAPKGFKSLDAMYEAFVEVLKSEDDSQLRVFSEAVAPDAYTIEFMKRVRFRYRGIPERMMEQGITVEALSEKYFERFKSFRGRLKARQQLSSLEYVRYEKPMAGVPYQNFGEPILVLAIENAGLLKSGEREIKYKMGELLNIDGFWKSFTQPRQL